MLKSKLFRSNLMSNKANLFLSFLFLCLNTRSAAQSKQIFPLALSENQRYLIDQQQKPFLIKEFSAWGLIQALSEKDEAAFLDSIKKKGFNTVMVSIISNAPSQMGGNPPYWQGISPFLVKWDFATPNEIYFQHVDRFFKMAEQKGIFVLAVPCYLGYRDDPSQGWSDEVLNPSNDSLKMLQYGTFLGKRYQNAPNLLWVAGGDNNAEGKYFPYIKNLITGIKSSGDKHLWTGHFDTNLAVYWSTDNPLYADQMDIDGLYVWTESVMFEKGPQYRSAIQQYKKGKMIIQLDQSYEHDVPHYADNENYQWIRRKNYGGLLSGCAGTSFSAGQIDNQCYSFKNWKPLMNTQGMREVAHCLRLFDALPWHKLVPDTSTDIILSDRLAQFGSRDFICAARATDGSFYVMYLPKGQPFEINVKKISGKPMRMHWYNPRTGVALKIGVADTKERFGVAPPSEEDWVLVFDNDPAFKMPNKL